LPKYVIYTCKNRKPNRLKDINRYMHIQLHSFNGRDNNITYLNIVLPFDKTL